MQKNTGVRATDLNDRARYSVRRLSAPPGEDEPGERWKMFPTVEWAFRRHRVVASLAVFLSGGVLAGLTFIAESQTSSDGAGSGDPLVVSLSDPVAAATALLPDVLPTLIPLAPLDSSVTSPAGSSAWTDNTQRWLVPAYVPVLPKEDGPVSVEAIPSGSYSITAGGKQDWTYNGVVFTWIDRFGCAACRSLSEQMHIALDTLVGPAWATGTLDLSVSSQQDAMLAEGVACAAVQGSFWDTHMAFHEEYNTREKVAAATFPQVVRIARASGVPDIQAFSTCLVNGDWQVFARQSVTASPGGDLAQADHADVLLSNNIYPALSYHGEDVEVLSDVFRTAGDLRRVT